MNKTNKKRAITRARCCVAIASALIGLCPPESLAAHVSAADLARMEAEASHNGWARVQVNLASVGLDEIRSQSNVLKERLDAKASALQVLLGSNALADIIWKNGLGQAGLLVNERGLKQLSDTTLIESFAPDGTWSTRLRVRDDDGSVAAVEERFRGQRLVDVELELEFAAEYRLASDGGSMTAPGSTNSNATAALQRVVARQNQGQVALLGLPASGQVEGTAVGARVTREAFEKLVFDENVRAIRPLGFQDRRPAEWSQDVLARADKLGVVEVVMTLRGGTRYSPKGGHMSGDAWKLQGAAHRQAFDEILSNAGEQNPAGLARYDELGVLNVRLNRNAVKNLYVQRDPRVLSIGLNRPAAWSQLLNSAQLINLPQAWSAGYRAAGQNIIVIDSGIRKEHGSFAGASGTRVTYEACFGTRASYPTLAEDYFSICPSANEMGDSPLGLAGSGRPWSDSAACAALRAKTTDSHDCGHGTHVAGVAGARASTAVSPSYLQGVAPDASLVAVQVFSYDKTNIKATAFNADLVAAMNAVHAATAPGTANPFVVNLSLGGKLYSADCPNAFTDFTVAVQNLVSRGVPVVAAAGNNSSRNGISFPACVPEVVKVSAVANDSLGTSLAGFSNIGAAQSFKGPILLAPGGSSTTVVTSAYVMSNGSTTGMRGTSQAAPHVAGLYAAIKAAAPAISVADATAWITSTGSIPVTYQFAAPVGLQTYRRIRVPNL